MKKFILGCFILLAMQPICFAQFSFKVFPQTLDGDPYADTLINTRAILLAAGVKKIKAYQTLPEVTKTFASKSIDLNTDGTIDKSITCFATNKETNLTHCITDSVVYDKFGRLVRMIVSDNAGNDFPDFSITYNDEVEMKSIYSNKDQVDTIVTYQTYNHKGQLVRQRKIIEGKETDNIQFYYNKDGLLDSIGLLHDTFVFRRRKKGKEKWIEMENYFANYKWVYNRSGQCMSSSYIVNDRLGITHHSGYKGTLKVETRYSYNPDGTLSKTTTSRTDKPTYSMHYSYVK